MPWMLRRPRAALRLPWEHGNAGRIYPEGVSSWLRRPLDGTPSGYGCHGCSVDPGRRCACPGNTVTRGVFTPKGFHHGCVGPLMEPLRGTDAMDAPSTQGGAALAL